MKRTRKKLREDVETFLGYATQPAPDITANRLAFLLDAVDQAVNPIHLAVLQIARSDSEALAVPRAISLAEAVLDLVGRTPERPNRYAELSADVASLGASVDVDLEVNGEDFAEVILGRIITKLRDTNSVAALLEKLRERDKMIGAAKKRLTSWKRANKSLFGERKKDK